MQEGQKKNRNSNKMQVDSGYSSMKQRAVKSIPGGATPKIEEVNIPHSLDIFGSLTEEKKAVKERQKKDSVSPANSKAGKLQTNNSTNIQQVAYS